MDVIVSVTAASLLSTLSDLREQRKLRAVHGQAQFLTHVPSKFRTSPFLAILSFYFHFVKNMTAWKSPFRSECYLWASTMFAGLADRLLKFF